MMLKQFFARQPKDVWIILPCYALIYLFYYWGLGLQFLHFDMAMQYLSPNWLETDLLRSLFYLHSQPPLYNFYLALIFKTCSTDASQVAAYEVTYLLAALVGLYFLIHALKQLGVRLSIRLCVCFMLCLFPTFTLYGAWLYTPHFEFCLCAALACFLARFYSEPPEVARGNLIPLFSICCLLGLLRPQWHLVVFVGLGIVMLGVAGQPVRRMILRAFCICLLPLILWYSKNLVLFDFWGPSSWMGGNLSQVVDMIVSKPEKDYMASKGLISPDFPAGVWVFDRIIHRIPVDQLAEKPVHVSLGPYKTGKSPNFNYVGVIESAKQDMHDSLFIISTFPNRYWRKVSRRMWDVIWTPSYAYPFMRDPRIMYKPVIGNYELLSERVRWWLELGSFLLYGCIPVLMLTLAVTRRWSPYCINPAWQAFILCGVYMVLVMTFVSCALNHWEQERMRWGIAPFYICFLGMLMELLAKEGKRLAIRLGTSETH